MDEKIAYPVLKRKGKCQEKEEKIGIKSKSTLYAARR
jgi:hypothetical protein